MPRRGRGTRARARHRSDPETNGWVANCFEGGAGTTSSATSCRAFDLATGSAYRVGSCSGLSAHVRRRRLSSRDGRRRGRTIRAAWHGLDRRDREAAWMLLQLGELDEAVLTSGFGLGLAEAACPAESDGGKSMTALGLGSSPASSATSAQHGRCHWPGRDEGVASCAAAGSTWPSRDLNRRSADAYAAELARSRRRPSASKPWVPAWAAPGRAGRSSITAAVYRFDADTDSVITPPRSLRKAWRDSARPPRPLRRARHDDRVAFGPPGPPVVAAVDRRGR